MATNTKTKTSNVLDATNSFTPVSADLLKAQPAYGVKPTPIWTIQPQVKYGVVSPGGGSGTTINMKYEELEENIKTLKSAISTLRDSWTNETKKNLQTLENSWVGADCSAYTSRLSNMDNKVQKTIQALELLCTTYEKARDMVKETQEKALSSINGM